MCECQKRCVLFFPAVSHKRWGKTLTIQLTHNLKDPSGIPTEISTSQSALPKSFLQHQRVDLFVYAATVGFQKPQTGTSNIQCSLLSFPDFFLSAFSSDIQKRTNVFLLGISWPKLPAFTLCIHCTVMSPAFRTCQNYCTCCFTQHFPECLGL